MPQTLKWKVKTALKIIPTFKNLNTYLRDMNGKLKGIGTYRLWSGEEFVVRFGTSDRGIINEVYADKMYAPEGFKIKENDVVVDIGAHIGIFSIYASRKSKNGRVFSIEPFPDNFELLNINLMLNNTDNATTCNYAISKKTGIRNLFVADTTGGHSLVFSRKGKTLRVHTLSFGDFMKKFKLNHIDFLKVDCEGAEFEIFEAMQPENFSKIGKIVMELHDEGKGIAINKMKELLEKNGFEVKTDWDYQTIYAKQNTKSN